jgi:hypothetical protein
MAGKVVSGARCKVSIDGQVVGIFNSISYGLSYDTQPVYILGRFTAAEIDYTAQEVVGVTCTGWRVIGHGPHVTSAAGGGGSVPKLQDLLTHDYISLLVEDRQTGKQIATISNVRPTGYSTTVSQRQLEEITVNFVGILISDETADNSEAPGATDLPQEA